MESYLSSVNIKVIVNGKTYNDVYNYGGKLTINNVIVNNNKTNNVKIEIPYFNMITLNTNSNNITITPVETMMTFKRLQVVGLQFLNVSGNKVTSTKVLSGIKGLKITNKLN